MVNQKDKNVFTVKLFIGAKTVSFILFTYSQKQHKAFETIYDKDFRVKFNESTGLSFVIVNYEELSKNNPSLFGLKIIDDYIF